MSDTEIKEIEKENKEKTKIEEKCSCCEFCKAMKNILTIAIGTFVGFYCAFSLFFALHKPSMMHHHKFKKSPYGMEQNFYRGKHFDKRFVRPEKPFKPVEIPKGAMDD